MTVFTQEDYDKRAAKGAALLDEKRPGWFRKVVFKRLDMADECRCVLGQLDSRFWTGIIKLELNSVPDADSDYGFDIPPEFEEPEFGDRTVAYVSLRNSWISEIRARKSAARARA